MAKTNYGPTLENEVIVHQGNGYGSTGTSIRRFTTIEKDIGSAITYADSSTDGASFTINEDGIYAIAFMDAEDSGNTNYIGLSKSANSFLATDITSITVAQGRLVFQPSENAGQRGTVSWAGELSNGDIIRPHTDGGTPTSENFAYFIITKVRDL